MCVGFPRHGIVVCAYLSTKCEVLASITTSCFRRRTRTLKPTEGRLPAILGDLRCYFAPIIGYVPGVANCSTTCAPMLRGSRRRRYRRMMEALARPVCASTAEHIALHVFSPQTRSTLRLPTARIHLSPSPATDTGTQAMALYATNGYTCLFPSTIPRCDTAPHRASGKRFIPCAGLIAHP